MISIDRARHMSAAILLVGAALLAGTVQASEEANILFGEALEVHRAAQAAEGAERLDGLREVQAILSTIQQSYPDSVPGQRLRSGERLGPIDPVDIAFELSQSEPAPLQAAPAPTSESAFHDFMKERFATECAATARAGTTLPCPYVERMACSGEGCRKSGVVLTRRGGEAVTVPGGRDTAFRMAADEYLVSLESRIFSVPCRGTIRKSVDGFAPGTPVHQLSYAGEGTYRILLDGRTLSQSFGDEIQLAPGCDNRGEEWHRLRNAAGQEGWIRRDHETFRGLDEFGGDDEIIDRAPAWAHQVLTAEETRSDSPAFKARYCASPGDLLSGDEIARDLLGARAILELAGRVGGRYYLTRQGPDTARGLIVFDEPGLPDVFGEITVKADMICLRQDRSASDACDRVRACPSEFGARYILESEAGAFSAMLSSVELSGSEMAREVRPASGRLITEEMASWDYTHFQPCVRNAPSGLFTADCLVEQGLPADIARRYAQLGQIMDDKVIVNAVRNFGDAQLVDIFHPTFANSNDQQYLFLNDKLVEFDYSGVEVALEQGRTHDALAIRRAYPKAFIDTGRGHVSYFRLKGGTPVVYETFTILNGCRACEPVGLVAVKTTISDGRSSSYAVQWSTLEPGEWSEPGPELSALLPFLSNRPKTLQGLLSSAGYLHGAIDGVIGAQTKRALREFQHEHCIDPVVGLDQQSAEALWQKSELWGGCHDA